MSEATTGRSLWECVSLRPLAAFSEAGARHRATCRSWVSGPRMAQRAPRETRAAGGTLQTCRPSGGAERGFRGQCGAHMFHRPRPGPGIAVSTGFGPPVGLKRTRQFTGGPA
jgi:hypothetical protein